MSAHNRGPNICLTVKNQNDSLPSKSPTCNAIFLSNQAPLTTLSSGCTDDFVQGNWGPVQYQSPFFGAWPDHALHPMPGSPIYVAMPSQAYDHHNTTIFPASMWLPQVAQAQPTLANLTGTILKRNDDIAIKVRGGYQCAHPGCSKIYAQKYSIKRHRETVHNKNREKIPCRMCNRTFGYFRELNRHVSKAHEAPRHHCPCLDRKFSRLYLLTGQCPHGVNCPGAIDYRKSSNTT